MSSTTTPDPKLRKLLIAGAFSVALALQGWAVYLKTAQHPAPRWTEGLPTAIIELVFGFYFLLSPPPGMPPSIRRLFVVIFFGLAALLFFVFLKG